MRDLNMQQYFQYLKRASILKPCLAKKLPLKLSNSAYQHLLNRTFVPCICARIVCEHVVRPVLLRANSEGHDKPTHMRRLVLAFANRIT